MLLSWMLSWEIHSIPSGLTWYYPCCRSLGAANSCCKAHAGRQGIGGPPLATHCQTLAINLEESISDSWNEQVEN